MDELNRLRNHSIKLEIFIELKRLHDLLVAKKKIMDMIRDFLV